MYFDSKTYQPPSSEAAKDGKVLLDHWEASLLKVGDIDTVSDALLSFRSEQVESFCRHFNNIRLPSRLNKGANYHLFKKGIRPVSDLDSETPEYS
jgi:translation initiation factor 4E